jgi:Tfp pilus assembly protein PilF
VKLISEKFRVTQEPVFCCEEKKSTTIGIVDSSFSMAWNQLKDQQVVNTVATVKTQRNNAGLADTALLALYNHFNAARKENRLWGDNSADSYYELMQNRFQHERITEDARYTLAADFINFAQQKINLYLEGKDLLSVEILKEKADSSGAPGFLDDEYDRMKKSVSEKWTVTAMMIQKAGKLLSSNTDSSLLLQLKPRINFLMARGYLSREKENKLDFYQALQCALEAWKEDSTAAYTAECLALMYTYKRSLDYKIRVLGLNEEDFPYTNYFGTGFRSDTAFYFYNKAIQLAPHWVSPYRSIGLKLYGFNSMDTAKMFMRKAINLNPADGSNYILLGDLVGGSQPDSTLFYYKRALTLTPKTAHAEIYRKIGGVFMSYSTGRWYVAKTDSALAYYRQALDADPQNVRAYTNIAYVFTQQNKPDSVLRYALAAAQLAPGNRYPYQLAIEVYSTKKQPDSILHYSTKLLQADPKSGYAASEIARYYDKKGINDSAIHYYKRSLVLQFDQEYCRERLGFLIMDKDKNDPSPLAYFSETMQETPFAWRSYFNIACYYSHIRETEKSIEFLEKALQKGMKVKQQIYSVPYLSFIREGEPFKKLMAKYFPE